MPEATLRAKLLGDAVFSTRSGTGVGHETLTFIPGAALLGAAARRLYSELSPSDALLVFHSGRVRFGALRPEVDGRPTVPVPLSWHHPKGEAPVARDDGRGEGSRSFAPANVRILDPARLWNLADLEAKSREFQRQPVPLKKGYVSASGDWLLPTRRLHLKSARDRETRRTREGALFAYEALAAGLDFTGTLSWDEDVPRELVDRLLQALAGEHRLGHSRFAEFGRTRIEVKEHGPTPLAAATGSREVRLLCASEVALADANGRPTERPDPACFGLRGRWASERSFIRRRRYAPFNGKRRAPDLERSVLLAGSVLVFELEEELAPEALRQLSSCRHGLHVQDGLGEVLANPRLLSGPHPVFEARPTERRASTPEPICPKGPLARWASQQTEGAKQRDVAVRTGRELFHRLRAAAEQLAPELRPQTGQWNRLRELAGAAQDKDGLSAALKEVTDRGVAKQAWGERVWADGEASSLRKLLANGLPQGSFYEYQQTLLYVSKEMARWSEAQERREEEVGP